MQPLDRTIEQKGWFKDKLYDWETTTVAWPMSMNFFNGKAIYNGLDRGFIPNLGALEIVDLNQWRGRERLHLKYRNGQSYQLERVLWNVVAVDQVNLERMNFAYTHAEKDDVFRLQMRLGQIFDAVKTILAPWDDLARSHYANGYEALSDVPEGQREASKEMLDAIKHEWVDNTPTWAK